MSYDLRRLRLHGLITRVPGTHRYTVTDFGLRVALFLTRLHNRVVRPGLAEVLGPGPPLPTPLRQAFNRAENTIDDLARRSHLAA
jgi:hypothetical protein